MKKIVAIYQSFVVPLKSEGIKQMRKDKREAISKVKAYKQLLSDYFKFEKVYLFGSYAKDTFEKDSDIDVAIVVNHIEGDYFSVNPLLWKLRRQVDDRIEPILIEKDNDHANFLEEIQKYGIEIV